MHDEHTYAAFEGDKLIAAGDLATVLSKAKGRFDRGHAERLILFEDQTGRQVDFDFRGTVEEVVARAIPKPRPQGRGRPKLGVLSREVSLLPRHWEWLEEQPNGISAALRRLIDEARKRDPGEQRRRLAREAAYRFMTAMAGNLEGYEEATRALFAKDQERFASLVRPWPADVRKHAARLAEPSFLVGLTEESSR
jgi:uncharacterized protein